MARITKRSVDALKAGTELTRSGRAKDSYLWDRGEGALAANALRREKKFFCFNIETRPDVRAALQSALAVTD